MKFFDAIFNRDRDPRVNARPEKPPQSLAERILKEPALFNRATRRSIGLYGRFWKWDVNVDGMRRTYVPRYIRRHYQTQTMRVPHTRRQRKERARILRISRAKGLV